MEEVAYSLFRRGGLTWGPATFLTSNPAVDRRTISRKYSQYASVNIDGLVT